MSSTKTWFNPIIRTAACWLAGLAVFVTCHTKLIAADPLAISAYELKLEPFEAAGRPEFLAKAARLVPDLKKPNPGLLREFRIQFKQPGAIFIAAASLKPPASPDWTETRLREIYSEQRMLWIGRCPWKKSAQYFVLPVLDPRLIAIKLPSDMRLLNGQGEELADIEALAVDNMDYSEPQHTKAFGAIYDSGMMRLKAESLFRTKKWDQLEQLFSELRMSHQRMPDGESALGLAYKCILSPDRELRATHKALMKEYQDKFPDSTAVQLQQISILTAAWKKRGTGSADTVSEEAQTALKKMAEDSKVLLAKAKTGAPGDPFVDDLQIVTMAGGQAKAADFPTTAIAGLKNDPWQLTLVESACNYLLPRWFGESKSTSAFAKQLQMEFASTSGSALYCVAALTVFNIEPDEWERSRGFDYQQMLKGLEALRRKLPEDRRYTVLACKAAGHRGDLATARKLYDSISERMFFDDWKEDGAAVEWYEFLHPPAKSQIAWQASILAPGWNRVQFDASGDKLYVASPLNSLRIFEAKSGKLLSSFSLGLVPSFGVGVNTKGEAVVTSELRTNFVKNGKGTKTVPITPRLNLFAGDLAPNGRIAAGIANDLRGMLLLPETGKYVFTDPLAQFPGPVMSAKISSDGKRVAFCTGEPNVTVFDITTGKLLKSLSFERSIIEAIAFHSQGKRLVATNMSSKGPGVIWEWDVDSGDVLWNGPIPASGMRKLAVTEDGSRIAMAQEPNYELTYDTKLWIMSSKQPVDQKDFVIEQRQQISDMKWSPNGQKLAVVGNGGFVKMFNLSPSDK